MQLESAVLRVIGLSFTDTTISLFQNVSHSQARQPRHGGGGAFPYVLM